MLLNHIHSSLLRFCSLYAEQNPGMEIVNFDASGDESQLPQADVVGIYQMSVTADEGVCGVDVLIGVSTREDTNLFRLNDHVAKLFDLLLPTRRIKLYNADSGALLGWLVVQNGTRTLPIGGSSTRPLQYVMVSLLSSVTLY